MTRMNTRKMPGKSGKIIACTFLALTPLTLLTTPISAGTCDGATYTCPATATPPSIGYICLNGTPVNETTGTYSSSTQGSEYDEQCCIANVDKICHDYNVTCLYNFSWYCYVAGLGNEGPDYTYNSQWTGSSPSPTGVTSTGCILGGNACDPC
jgi:hypothetical protein